MPRRNKKRQGKKKTHNSQMTKNKTPAATSKMETKPVEASTDPENNITHFMSSVINSEQTESQYSALDIPTESDTFNTVPYELSGDFTDSNCIFSSNNSAEGEIYAADVPSKQLTNKENLLIFFTIIEKLAKLLKSGNGSRLITIFEKVLHVTEDENAEKVNKIFEIMHTCMTNIEDCNLEYLLHFQETLKGITFPRELRKLFIDKSMITDLWVRLGEGAFGEVTIGCLNKSNDSVVKVAIKQTTRMSFENVLMQEARVMSQLDHEDLIKLLAVTKSDGSTRLILELMDCGDIWQAIFEDLVILNATDLLLIIHDVVSGMEYLASKQYVHRDLRCKNVFINTKKKCKIGDFGLCKYVGDSGGVYRETKWTLNGYHVAPESKTTNKFTTKSDVWAMGTLIWELYSGSKEGHSVDRLLFTMSFMANKFPSLNSLPLIRGCPIDLHKYTVEKILNENPNTRPEFKNIKAKVTDILKSKK